MDPRSYLLISFSLHCFTDLGYLRLPNDQMNSGQTKHCLRALFIFIYTVSYLFFNFVVCLPMPLMVK